MRQLLVLGRPHWRVLGLSFAFMAIVAVTTGAYAWLMGPALHFLLTGGAQGLDLTTRFMPDLGAWARDDALVALPVVIIVIGALKGLGYLGQFYSVGLFGQLVVVDLRRRVFERLLGLSPLQRSTRLSGDLLSRFTSDVAAVELAATYTVASWLRDSLQVATLVALAFTLSWELSVVALVVVPIAVWPASRLTQALLRRTRQSQASLGLLAGQVQEGLGALKTIQAFNAEHAELTRFVTRSESVAHALTRAGWSRAAVPGLMEILASTAIAGTLGWAMAAQAVEPKTLVSFLGTLVLLYQPAKDLGRVSHFAVAAATALDRLSELLRLRPGVVDAVGARTLSALTKGISLHDVRFAWGQRPALNGLSLELPVGQVTALVGESGSGKSTVVSLLLRFEAPSSGSIFFDGVDVQQATVASVRAQFALVTQEALLFSATVRENVLIAKPTATDAELEAAARVAHAMEFITALPQGWSTPIGERGVTLSGGQKQRLCLARAVLAQAPVLILDEATSNLDTESEREVQSALDEVLRGRTAVLVAHRLSSVTQADRIAVLSAGRVVEQGSHTQLLADRGAYAALWAKQHAFGE